MTAIITSARDPVGFLAVGHLTSASQVLSTNVALQRSIDAIRAHELASQRALAAHVEVITSDSESSEEADSKEVALKVAFYVTGACIRFNDPSALRSRGYDVTSETAFFKIGVQAHSADDVDAWKLEYIPVDLVENALAAKEQTVQFTWNDREIDLRFMEKGKMTEDEVLDRIRDVKKGLNLESVDMPTAKRVLFYVNHAYMPKIA